MNRLKNLDLPLLIAAAAATEIVYLFIARIPDLRNDVPLYLLSYGILFAIYWLAARRFFDFNQTSGNGFQQPTLSTKQVLWIGLIFGIVFRLTMLASQPSFSDDIYRYLWDGRVAANGINPYRYAPAADELAHLRDDSIYPRINHMEIPTVYPPVNQLFFAAIYKIYPSVAALKAALMVIDLLTVAILLMILRQLGIDLCRGLIYAWNPLVIIEFSGSGHIDILGIFFLSLSLWLFFKNKFHASNFALALSFLTKFFTVVLWPVLFLLKKNRKALAIVFSLLVVALYLPYVNAGGGLFSGLLTYSEKWQFNDSIFALVFEKIKPLLPESLIYLLMLLPYGYSPDATTLQTRGIDLALMISKGTVAIIFAVIFYYFMKRLRSDLEREGERWIAKLGLILMGGFFLLSPTVQPWYLCWLLPFLVISPNRAWLLLTGLIGLSYWTLIEYANSGIWQESLWVKFVEYGPFYLILISDYLKSRWPTEIVKS